MKKNYILTGTTTVVNADVQAGMVAKREARATLKELLINIGEEIQFDSERIERSIATTRRSMYGEIPALIIAISAKYAWPISAGQSVTELPELQDRIIEILEPYGIDSDLLLDIKEAKGFNSFLDMETFKPVQGIVPEYDEFEFLLTEFAVKLGIKFLDLKLSPAVYDKRELIALKDIENEQKEAELALALHEEMMGEGE